MERQQKSTPGHNPVLSHVVRGDHPVVYAHRSACIIHARLTRSSARRTWRLASAARTENVPAKKQRRVAVGQSATAE